MASNPCPWMPLEKGVKVLAIIDAVVNGILLLVIGYFLIMVSTDSADNEQDRKLKVILIIAFAVTFVFKLFEFGLAFVLYNGGENRNPRTLRIWRIITTFIVTLTVFGFISNIVKGKAGSESVWFLFWIPFKIYELVVVFAFTKHVENGESGNGTLGSATGTDLPEPAYAPPHYAPKSQPV